MPPGGGKPTNRKKTTVLGVKGLKPPSTPAAAFTEVEWEGVREAADAPVSLPWDNPREVTMEDPDETNVQRSNRLDQEDTDRRRSQRNLRSTEDEIRRANQEEAEREHQARLLSDQAKSPPHRATRERPQRMTI
ncbi:hypothetical protein BS47DRAFT_1101264 [Hydnum rufescens UP504]|uniref:Uncharacterized protein n=1 Tax=Hydnum rufescens UP504 TaxID=1448309 RepID=A0A9P6AUG7_9AGAM|nr:hypothetical protein BS47DRAFT_1101264 [Hydnum rufescens UP504]